MDTLIEGQFGHGAIEKKLDLRDQKLGSASAPFDWSSGYDIETALGAVFNRSFVTPTKNQGQSYSCGGQAGSYLEATLKALGIGSFDEKSAKYIYSQIFYPTGGSTLRDVLNLITRGVASESQVVSYEAGNPPSETFMRDTSHNSGTNASTSLATGYAFVHPDIESVAQAVRDNHGAIILIQGQDNGTWLSATPKAPVEAVWAHFLFCGKAKLINGKKYIGVHNSWGNIGENGWQWISEDYFNSGFITDCGVVYQDASNLKTRIALVQKALALAQKLLNFLFGPTKKPLISG